MGWNKVRPFPQTLTKAHGYSFHYQWHVKPPLRSGPAIGSEAWRHRECVLRPQRIQSSQMRQIGVNVSTSRRNCSSWSKKGFSGQPVMAFEAHTRNQQRMGTELKTIWIARHLCLCHETCELSVKPFFPRPCTPEASISFTDYCLWKFTSACLTATPKIENNYNRFSTVLGPAVQNMAKSTH